MGFGAKETCRVVLNIDVNNFEIPVILPACSFILFNVLSVMAILSPLIQ